jgi:hypothetical protein
MILFVVQDLVGNVVTEPTSLAVIVEAGRPSVTIKASTLLGDSTLTRYTSRKTNRK